MKRLVLTLVALALLATTAMAGDIFPDLDLKGTLSKEDAAYLGITATPAKLSSIKAKYVFVEIYSMYCPICQRDAPKMDKIYHEVMAAGRDNIKFLGIGAGNTQFEIDFYKKKFEVPFPLFEDEDFTCHKAVGGVGTPAFYLVDLEAGRSLLFFQEGELEDEAGMLKMILDKTAK